jgi:hypothetical protein
VNIENGKTASVPLELTSPFVKGEGLRILFVSLKTPLFGIIVE